MRGISTDKGMETPLSIFLLLSATLLIASSGGILLTKERDESALYRLRLEQVRSMGKVLSSWEPDDRSGTLLENILENKEPFLISNVEDNEKNLTILKRWSFAFISCAPDGLDCYLITEKEHEIFLDGEHVEWRFEDDIIVRVVLPLRNGGLEVFY